MKVLLINGSPRRSGNTSLALAEAAKTLQALGIETETVSIGAKLVRGCIACNQCKTKGRCIFDDDLCNATVEKMAACDALIIGAPVYYGQPNATALALLQRMLYSGGAHFAGKPAAGVAVCRRGGATAALQTLIMPFQMMSMPVVTSQYWNIVYGREPGQAALDTEGMQTMRTLARNMAHLLQSTHAPVAPALPEREPWQPMHFIR
ncbi:MAG: flavodoxin family protein [Bacteroidaceae bacterium]|nr:flavodoxin family protein [Bacteroidaceae bacterium]